MRANTLLLINDHLIARIDVRIGADVAIESIDTIARPDNASLESLIQSALSLNPKRPHPVLLFSSDFWSGCISIPSDLHALANSEELIQAAILEAETLSGIPAFQSQLAIQRIENDPHGDPQYWVTQFQNTDLDCIDQILRSAKARWIGTAHPNSSYASSTNGVGAFEESLATESDIRTWVVQLGKELLTKALKRPIYSPPPKPVSQKTQHTWSAIAASLTLSACAAMFIQNKYTLLGLEQRSEFAAKQQEEAETLNRQIQKLELTLVEKRKRLREDRLRLESSKSEMDVLQRNQLLVSTHCASLVEAIASSADADSWLKKIESKDQRTLLRGISLSEASAHRFASALELHPKLAGHLVNPAQTTTLENELIEFSIAIDLIAIGAGTAQIQKASP